MHPASLINNTGVDIRGMVETAIRAAIKRHEGLPEELADLFILTKVGDDCWRLDNVEDKVIPAMLGQ